jgi:hypothetical protein
VFDLVRGQGAPLAEAGDGTGDWDGPPLGRHAYDEDAELTPIFHALTRGGWRNRHQERQLTVVGPDPMEAFRQDPLGAPIPSQAMRSRSRSDAASRRRSGSGAHAKPEARGSGRHHRRFITAGD